MSGIYNFTIEQGVTFRKTGTWSVRTNPSNPESALTPVNMTGLTARMEIRTRDGVLLATPTITLNPTAGEITFSLTDTQTELLDFDTAIYDLEIMDSMGVVIKRLIKGTVTLDKEVTEDLL